MTLLFMDSFDHYAAADLNKKWSTMGGAGISMVAGRNGNALQLTGVSGAFALKGVGQRATLVCGFAFAITSLGNDVIVTFYDAGFAEVHICVTAAGAISISCATNNTGGNTVVATSATTPITANVWYYVEAKCTLDDVNGYVEVLVDGVSVVDFTGDTHRQTAGLYTQLAGICLHTLILSFQDNRTLKYDDLYILDTLGTVNNDFIGDCRIACLLPDGEGTTQEWTPLGGGAHYTEVDEASMDSDTTYEELSAATGKTLYAFQSLSGVVGAVAAVQTVAATRKLSTGGALYNHIIRSQAVDSPGDDKSFAYGAIYNFTTQMWEVDPSDSNDWTEARVNALEAGVDRIA